MEAEMIRTLLRVVLLLVLVAAVGAFFFGYWMADRGVAVDREPVVGTAGSSQAPGTADPRGISAERARAAGARIGESIAVGADRAQRAAADAALTAKIKSKMALDDTVRAAAIDVDTANGTVTLNGSVSSAAARERAVQLARETEGVTAVNDLLVIQQ